MSHYNHRGRPGKVGGSLPSNQLTRLFYILKGGKGSGNIGHVGIPGHRGGSAPSNQGYIDQMTENEISSIWEWTGDKYLDVALQDSKGSVSPSLKSALEKSPDYKGHLQRFDHREFNGSIGDVIELPALTSFAQKGSSLEQSRGGYEKTKYVIKNGKGKSLLFSHRPQEKEVVISKGSKLKVINITRVPLPPYGNNKKGVIQKVIELEQL